MPTKNVFKTLTRFKNALIYYNFNDSLKDMIHYLTIAGLRHQRCRFNINFS